MPCIARENEIKQLNTLLKSKRAEFVVVYGRRRVGKTYLIRSYFSEAKCDFFQLVGMKEGGERLLSKQLDEFRLELERVFYKDFNSTRLDTPKDWHQALAMLNDALTLHQKLYQHQQKCVLFFDEFPWMATPKSGLLEAIEYYWNRYWVTNPNLILILCGSAASWMIENILNNKAGLHNRVTHKLLLSVFTLPETDLFLKSRSINMTPKQLAEIYMCLGGVPYYLERLTKNKSAAQNIDTLCFNPEGALANEFNNLYASLFKQPEPYIELVRLIASKTYGMSRKDIEKYAKLSTKGGTLTKRLHALERSGFIIKMKLPHQKRNMYYQCLDEFTLFYLNWMEKLEGAQLDDSYFQSMYATPTYYAWAGIAFELLCFKHLSAIRKGLNIPAGTAGYAWRANGEAGAQIDLVFDRNDGVINLCEIKFTEKPFNIDKNCYEGFLKKIEIFRKETKTDKQVFLSLVSANGLKENQYSGMITGVVNLKDLVNGK